MDSIVKFPRTRHIRGSRLQDGDEDLEAEPIESLRGKHVVVEEKVDGANSGISFDSDTLEMHLQSRGHYLAGGARERHFNLFKRWASTHESWLMEKLQDRYIAYGEWCYARHTEFYDRLPHYWMEFDVLDKKTNRFMSTAKRREFWAGCPVVSVPVLFEGVLGTIEELRALVRPSLYKSQTWRQTLAEAAQAQNLDLDRVQRETDMTDLAEGVYIKVETPDETIERYKYVRAAFVQQIKDSETHWLSRPVICNNLAPGVDIFGSPHVKKHRIS
jgi:hypothetical protein